MADDLVRIVNLAGLRTWPRLVVDASGCGNPVLEMIRDSMSVCPMVETWGIVITGGLKWSPAGNKTLHVPKIELVGAVRETLESGRLKISRDRQGRPRRVQRRLEA